MASAHPQSVIVIGAGIVGAASAYFLARAGFGVRLVEAVAPAAGASGAADGAVSVASKRAGPMMAAALAGVALYRGLAADGLFADLFKPRPTLMVAESDEEAETLEYHAAALVDAGVRIVRHDGAVLRTEFPVVADAVRLVIEVQGEGHAIGYEIVNRLVSASGVKVERRRGVERLVLSGDGRVEAALVDGEPLRADLFVVAAGAGSGDLLGLDGVLRPRKGQLLVTDRAPGLNAALRGSLMSCRYLLSKAATGAPAPVARRRFGLVIDPLRTGQFLIGGTREETDDGGNDLAAARRLLGDAIRLMPGLAQLRLLRAFTGVRTATADGLPLIGRAGSNLIVATGFEGDGICLGPLAGKVVAQLAAGQAPAIDLAPFDPDRFAAWRRAA